MPKHSRRPARIVFIEPAESQIRLLDTTQTARLDSALAAIAAAPDAAKPHATAPALRDYQHNGARVIYYSTALGSIIIATYIEVD